MVAALILARWTGLSRNFDDEGWVLIIDPVKRTDFIGFVTLNLAHPTSFSSRIIEIAGEPRNRTLRHSMLIGTMRSFWPLPYSLTSKLDQSTASRERLRTSSTRAPV